MTAKKTVEKTSGEKIDLAANIKELRAIAQWFETQSEVDIEEGLVKIKEGARLIKESRVRLADLENQFEEVKKELEN